MGITLLISNANFNGRFNLNGLPANRNFLGINLSVPHPQGTFVTSSRPHRFRRIVINWLPDRGLTSRLTVGLMLKVLLVFKTVNRKCLLK